jgi:aspartate aminotransferase-like enzyme
MNAGPAFRNPETNPERIVTALLPNVDPEGLLEYSVVYTDRALNHMSQRFQGVMKDISRILKQVYNAKAAVVVPGSGTFGMEAVARQFASGKKVLVIRNGWFSFRWTQIFDMGQIPAESIVLKARQTATGAQAPFAPPPIAEVVAAIREQKPDVVFAPHVETASGMILPDDYLKAIGDAVRAIDGLFVLDCVASGTVWVDMVASNVDVLISAPQKGWSASPCCALVALGERARARIDATTSTSFACDLKKWLQIMEAFENGGHAYHATMPTDALAAMRDVMLETEAYGFARVCNEQQELGRRVRALLEARGFPSVAAEGFKAPGVVVSYTGDPELQNGRKFLAVGLQTAAGVPLQCDEPADFRTFRIGLFGLEKLHNPELTVDNLAKALDALA